jgi:POT family proton-dependent oligopeptide transporter
MWSWTALAVASFLCAVAFPTYFKHLNKDPADFASRERQEGLQQPNVQENAGTVEGNGEKHL